MRVSSKNATILITMVVALILLAVGAVILLTPRPSQLPTSSAPTLVLVTGGLTLGGAGDSVKTLDFTDASGHVYHASLGRYNYSVFLPSVGEYYVTVAWAGSYPWQKGVENASHFYLNQTTGDATFPVEARTPDSNVNLSGLANATGATPTTVVFNGGGRVFAAPVSGGQYTVQLPNIMTYEVEIRWQGGECPAGSISVNASETYNLACSK